MPEVKETANKAYETADGNSGDIVKLQGDLSTANNTIKLFRLHVLVYMTTLNIKKRYQKLKVNFAQK